MITRILLSLLVTVVFVLVVSPTRGLAQTIKNLIVEIRTGDIAFAGTDDDIQLQIGGKNFPLDDPQRDDFQRGNTDRFEFEINDDRFSFDLIRLAGVLSVTKMQDSFFGGGWRFASITIWADSTASDPIYQNTSVDTWLDGDDLQWFTILDGTGWNLPQPRPFPPCVIAGDVDVPGAEDVVDSDCDGIADESDPSFDKPVDTDGDGLPDRFEDQTGTSAFNPDTDGDGWHDGGNRRSFLMLTRIECRDEQEDLGSDEIYLVAEDVRFPHHPGLRGYWALNDGKEVFIRDRGYASFDSGHDADLQNAVTAQGVGFRVLRTTH